MNEPIRFGVLGAAKIAGRSTVPAMQAADGVIPVAVAARDPQRAEDFATRHGLRAVSDYETLIQQPDVDAIYIALPNSLHARWARRAVAAGKHVLCEKSLTGSWADSQALIRAAAEAGLVLVENFMCARHPQHAVVREELARGSIGTLRHLDLAFGFPPFPRTDQRNRRELAGGALNDAGAYCAFMALLYAGRTPRTVAASMWSSDYEVDVTGSALLDFGDGLTSTATWGFLFDYRNEIRLWGSSGQITVDRAFSIPPDRTPHLTLIRNTEATMLTAPAADQFVLQLERFASLVKDEDARIAEYERTLTQAGVLEATRRSADSGQVIALDSVLQDLEDRR